MTEAGRWADLTPRLASAAVMVALAAAAVYSGGHVFHGFVALICAGMAWELMRMLAPGNGALAVLTGALAGMLALAAPYLPPALALPLLLLPPAAAFVLAQRNRRIASAYTALIVFAGYEMTVLRDHFSMIWLVWLILVVIASDVAGYFAGRMLGGPKFWPRISPKKTWSGTIAGWAGAALVGAGFWLWGGADTAIIGLSVVTALAAQFGDIAESAVKRMVGVKDSSGLIPGHGGLLDRFDAMLGAALFVLLVAILFDLPFGAV